MISIELSCIDKSFAPAKQKKAKVLDGLTITFPPGGIHCLIGNNGAGKTTLLKLILNLLQPDRGTLLWNGQRLQDQLPLKKATGVFLDTDYLVEELSGYEYLYLNGLLYQVRKETLPERIQELTGYFGLATNDLHKRIGSYSLGMKRKTGICAALLHEPDVLILDEPFANLDPVSARSLADFLKAYTRPDRTILVSAHDLQFVEELATRAAVLKQGSIVLDGTVQEIGRNNGKGFYQNIMDLLSHASGNHQQLKRIIR